MKPIRHVVVALSLLLLMIVIGTLGFAYLEELSLFDAFYMTIVTITTVGYGDITPQTFYGELFTMGLIIAGVGVTLYVFVEVMGLVLEGQLSEALGIAKVKRGVAKMKNHKIICGGGRTGSVIVEEFRNEGLEFVVIEHDPEVVKELQRAEIPVVEGDATKDEILIEAGVERASGLVSTLPTDCSNLLLGITAKDLNKNLELVVRASSEEAAKRLYSIGVKKVVIVEKIGGRRLAKSLINPAIVDFLDFATITGETSIETLKVEHGTKIANKKIKDLRIKEKIGATILAIIRDGKIISAVGPEDELRVGDTVVVIGEKNSVEKFEMLDSL